MPDIKLSAGVNFGTPLDEYIIEADGAGALTSARNAITGEEFVGGGGGGGTGIEGITTAVLTVIPHAPEGVEINDIAFNITIDTPLDPVSLDWESNYYTGGRVIPPAYKMPFFLNNGLACTQADFSFTQMKDTEGNFYNADTIVVSGNATYDNERGFYAVTGDFSVEITFVPE